MSMAARIFPLEYRNRNSVAYVYASETASPQNAPMVIAKLKEALAANPFAADLHANLLKWYSVAGDAQRAHSEFVILRRLAPRNALVLQLEKAGLK